MFEIIKKKSTYPIHFFFYTGHSGIIFSFAIKPFPKMIFFILFKFIINPHSVYKKNHIFF
ncbi:MAG TPA: hypothetical protein DCX70_04405 [Chitinophagaceae bacterium]|nr:hypothetical protein [Chitinophagaceae bacterium]